MAKYKKYLRLYDTNPTTGVDEMQLVETAAQVAGVSIEDFLSGAVLQTAARTVIEFQEQKTRELKAKMDAAVAAEGKSDEIPAGAEAVDATDDEVQEVLARLETEHKLERDLLRKGDANGDDTTEVGGEAQDGIEGPTPESAPG